MNSAKLGARATADGPRIEEDALRKVLGDFATGVVVVTTLGEDGTPVGLTVNSFNSVSLDPPLVLWSLSLDAPSLAAFRAQDRFVVNILAENQGDLCTQFAQPAHDKFAGVGYRLGLGGVPLLAGVVAHLECRTTARHAGGDHEIILGEVQSLSAHDRAPLVLHRGRFKRLAPIQPRN